MAAQEVTGRGSEVVNDNGEVIPMLLPNYKSKTVRVQLKTNQDNKDVFEAYADGLAFIGAADDGQSERRVDAHQL